MGIEGCGAGEKPLKQAIGVAVEFVLLLHDSHAGVFSPARLSRKVLPLISLTALSR